MSVVWFLSKRTPSTLIYAGLSASTVIPKRLVQEENATSPMLVTLLGMVTLVRPVPENATAPMFVTLLGIFTLVRLGQSKNVSSPMLVTLVGIVTLVRL